MSFLPRNRLPNCSDDLSHWSDVFSWRQIHYRHLIKAYEGTASVGVSFIIKKMVSCVSIDQYKAWQSGTTINYSS